MGRGDPVVFQAIGYFGDIAQEHIGTITRCNHNRFIGVRGSNLVIGRDGVALLCPVE